MATLVEVPILTPRTLNILGEAIPPRQLGLLQRSLDPVRLLFRDFLTAADGEAEEDFLIASCRYAHLRLEVIRSLLGIVAQPQLLHLVDEIPELAFDLLDREGSRLADGLTSLRNAWKTYARITKLLTDNLTALSQIQTPPCGLVMAVTQMDFGLTATTMYLEGEFPNANRGRLLYLCEAGEMEATTVEAILVEALRPADVVEEKLKTLRSLFGSWQGDDDADEDLKKLYESRA